eukprot:TCONS_00028877-protein
MLNNTTVEECMTSYSGRVYMSSDQINFLIAYDIATGFFNFLANGLVIFALVLSKQTGNPSLKLIFLLSVSDCCLAVVVQSLFAVMMFKFPHTQNCTFEMMTQFFGIFFTHTSGYIIALIGFDRYARVKFLTKYSNIMTSKRVKILVIIVILLSVVQATLYVLGTTFGIFDKTKKIGVAVDFIVVLSVVIVTIMAVCAVKSHRRNAGDQSMMKAVDQTVTRLASKILLTIIIFYVIYVIIAFLHSAQADKSTGAKRSWLEFGVFLGYLLTYTNSLVNALIFLSVNNKARMELLRRTFKGRDSKDDHTGSVSKNNTQEISIKDLS